MRFIGEEHHYSTLGKTIVSEWTRLGEQFLAGNIPPLVELVPWTREIQTFELLPSVTLKYQQFGGNDTKLLRKPVEGESQHRSEQDLTQDQDPPGQWKASPSTALEQDLTQDQVLLISPVKIEL